MNTLRWKWILLCFCVIFVLLQFRIHFYPLEDFNLQHSIDISSCIQFDPNQVTVLYDNPRILYYQDFLSNEDIDYIVKLAGDDLHKSGTRLKHGKDVSSSERTSSGKSLNQTNDYILRKIEEKIATWTHVSADNGEWFYFLRYDIGQEYKAHHDSFNPNELIRKNVSIEDAMGYPGARIATVLLYLQSPEIGGETQFPDVNITISPKSGDALLFWTYDADNEWNKYSLHAGLPVKKGQKLVLTKWIRENIFLRRLPLSTIRTKLKKELRN